MRGDARINLEILGRLGLTVVEIADSQAWELHFSEVSDCTLIVDAIFGTGLNAPLAGLIESVVADVNASGIPVVAIDLPSGLSADSPEPIGAVDRGGPDGDARRAEAAAGAAARPRRAPATSSSPTSASRPKCSKRSTARASIC